MKPYDKAIVFTGHMMDAPGRKEPRFPATMYQDVAASIRNSIKAAWMDNDHLLFISSAARGADIMALEVAQRLEIDTTIVFPHKREMFIRNSIGEPDAFCWERRMKGLLNDAATVTLPGTGEPSDYSKANDYMVEIALKDSGNVSLLAFWDMKPGGGVGGTEHFVNSLKSSGRDVEIIDAHAMLLSHLMELSSPVSQHE